MESVLNTIDAIEKSPISAVRLSDDRLDRVWIHQKRSNVGFFLTVFWLFTHLSDAMLFQEFYDYVVFVVVVVVVFCWSTKKVRLELWREL